MLLFVVVKREGFMVDWVDSKMKLLKVPKAREQASNHVFEGARTVDGAVFVGTTRAALRD